MCLRTEVSRLVFCNAAQCQAVSQPLHTLRSSSYHQLAPSSSSSSSSWAEERGVAAENNGKTLPSQLHWTAAIKAISIDAHCPLAAYQPIATATTTPPDCWPCQQLCSVSDSRCLGKWSSLTRLDKHFLDPLFLGHCSSFYESAAMISVHISYNMYYVSGIARRLFDWAKQIEVLSIVAINLQQQ